MRILHVIPSMSPLRGGPSFALRDIGRGLRRAGIEVHVATTDDHGPGHLAVPLGRPVAEETGTYWYFRRQTRFYTASWPLTRWLQQQIGRYDVVHIHYLFTYAGLPAAYYAKQNGVPYIVRPLGTLNRYGMRQRRPLLKTISFRLFERRMLAHAARIHYTSAQEQIEAEELGVSGKAEIIPLGIDLAPFAASAHDKSARREALLPQLAPCASDAFVILFLSRIDPKKGLDLLLPAFAKLYARRPDSVLVLAGSGEAGYIARLKQLARELGIAPALRWIGFLDQAAKLKAFAAADLFVLPSYSENFGISVVEAMASGLPVLISDQIGIHCEVAQTGAGMVAPCHSDALATYLIQLRGDHTLRRQMADAGRRLSAQQFSLPMMIENLVGMYADVCQTATI